MRGWLCGCSRSGSRLKELLRKCGGKLYVDYYGNCVVLSKACQKICKAVYDLILPHALVRKTHISQVCVYSLLCGHAWVAHCPNFHHYVRLYSEIGQKGLTLYQLHMRYCSEFNRKLSHGWQGLSLTHFFHSGWARARRQLYFHRGACQWLEVVVSPRMLGILRA
jgi:hypothetical protein